MSDKLTDDRTKHWTGARNSMAGMARIDGKPYRLAGRWDGDGNVPPMTQTALDITPTRTLYQFEAGGVHINLTFMSPLLPQDLDTMSRPVTYVTWDARSLDAQTHQVALYFDASAEWAVNTPYDKVVWSRSKIGDLHVLSIGTQRQEMLEKYGDDLRIDWGYFYLAIPPQTASAESIAAGQLARRRFSDGGALPAADDMRMPRLARDEMPVMAATMDLGAVGQTPVTRHLMLAYDDQYSVEYFHRRLRPYWRRGGMETNALLEDAAKNYIALLERCQAFDSELTTDLKRMGGDKYAEVAILAYRQTIAAHKLVADYDGTPLFFSKENFSNGSIDTVDVTYPSAPFFLLLNPQLLKAQISPIMDYARSPRWPWAYAPHDLGTYPLANGQTYGGGEKSEENQMPVEECGNMLILVAALAKVDGNADYAVKYWPVLTKWAEYLRDKGLDPENQLSTDDFAGHLAHNTNLSLKAIVALGGYTMLCDMTNRKSEAAAYRKLTRAMVTKWMQMADDGDHYRLAFDKTGTWSQKYNLVWDQLLGLKMFPPQVARREIAFYKTKQNDFGLPLDNRETYTKLDWIVWTATMAETPDDFAALVAPVYRFANETPTRVPLSDWYSTLNAKQIGFQARSVVGGVYIKMLSDPMMWKKWSARAK